MDYKHLILECLENNMQSITVEREKNYLRWKNWNRPGQKIVVFGAKEMGEICIGYLEKMDIYVDLICDNNRDMFGAMKTDGGKNIKIVSVEEAMSNYDNEEILCFLCTGEQHHGAIIKQLEMYNITEIVSNWHLDFYLEIMMYICHKKFSLMDKIRELMDFYDDEESLKIIWAHIAMLFYLESVPEKLQEITMEKLCVRPQYWLENGKYMEERAGNGIIIDCGAFIGDTVEDLIYKVGYDAFEQYDCYEMVLPVYEELNRNLDKISTEIRRKINTYNIGVGEEDAELKFSFSTTGNASVMQGGDVEVKIVKLDNRYVDKNVTFIKMDIEGSEQAALRGAQSIISICHPMCAICVYHSITAFWDVPRILKQYVPGYKLVLRHHTTFWDDTVCYAKIGEWR